MNAMENDNLTRYELAVDEPGIRIDKYVAAKSEGLSRTRAQKLIEDGRVRVNGEIARAGYKLEPGDRITVELPPPDLPAFAAEDIPLDIVYEDNDLLIVNKPAGMPVHPAPGHASRTLVNALLAHVPGFLETFGTDRPGIVHRLDKDTSGVMVVAKNMPARQSIMEQFKDRTVIKKYRVLVKGRLTPPEGVIEAPVGRDPRHRQQMAVVPESRGRDSVTEYTVLDYVGDFSLLEVRPVSGRTHQIRVHFKAIGYPVAGDRVYGVIAPPLKRQFVHAAVLGFILPSTGEYAEFTAPLPDDLQQAIDKLR